MTTLEKFHEHTSRILAKDTTTDVLQSIHAEYTEILEHDLGPIMHAYYTGSLAAIDDELALRTKEAS